MAFRPHQNSGKTPEELAAQRARRLQQRIARALLKEDGSGETAVDDAVRTLRATVNDPKERRATRDHAAGLLLSNANRAAGNVPSVTFNQGVQLNASDLLRLDQPEPSSTTTGCGPALPAAADPVLTPTSDLQGMHRLQEPVLPSDEPPSDSGKSEEGACTADDES